MTVAMQEAKRSIRSVPEHKVAEALVLEFAETNAISISLMDFYDDDCDFLQGLSERLNVPNDTPFKNKLRVVVRRLVNYGVMHGRMCSTAKEYIGEPAKQMNYTLKAGKAALVRRGKTDCTMEPEGEVAFLLRHAYPQLIDNRTK